MDKVYVVDRQRWAELSLFEQLGNIGSEVGRALAAKRREDGVGMHNALSRGLDLIDITAEFWAQKRPAATREILRAREQFVESITTPKEDVGLENYFMQYALAARLQR